MTASISAEEHQRRCSLGDLRMLVDMIPRHSEMGVKKDRVIRFCFSRVCRI